MEKPVQAIEISLIGWWLSVRSLFFYAADGEINVHFRIKHRYLQNDPPL